jgi:hypothetical protein
MAQHPAGIVWRFSMFDEKYLSVSEVSCFDNEPAGDPPAGDPPAGDPPAGDPPAGDPPAGGDKPKMHTTEAVNKIVEERLARDRKSREAAHKESYTKLEGTYNDLLDNKNLSDEVRAKAETELEDVRNQLRTKEERAKHEKDQLQTSFEKQLNQERADREMWENRYHDSTISSALQDAAVSNDAYNSDQVMQLLRPVTSLKPVVDETTKKETGQFRTVVDFPDHDETGAEVTFSGTPDEIVKRMKDLGPYANLFNSNVVSGLGAGNATGGIHTGSDGQVDVTKLTPAQYRKIRAETPELLGLKAK